MAPSTAKNRQDVRIASSPAGRTVRSNGPRRARRKFLRFFPGGFRDPQYLAWERDYKWHAHEQWDQVLSRARYAALLEAGRYAEIAAHAVRIESRTNLLFSFEK